MFDDIRELIDQAAPSPDTDHRNQLWSRFQAESQGTQSPAKPTVLRPPAASVAAGAAKPSDTIMLERITPIDPLAKRRSRRVLYVAGALSAAAVSLAVAGMVISSRNGNLLRITPASESTVTTAAPTAAPPSVTVAKAVAPVTTIAAIEPPVPSPTPRPTPPLSPKPKQSTTTTAAPAPVTKVVTVLAPDYVETMTAIGGWDGTKFVTLPKVAVPGTYTRLSGLKFEVTVGEPDGEGHIHATVANEPVVPGSAISFSDTSWNALPRPTRSQGDGEALKDARFNIYREEASRLAKELGAANAVPVLGSVLRADLDGDGTDEVLVTASYIDYASEPQGPMPAKVGSFSIAYVRHVVGNAAVSKVLTAVVVKDNPSIVPTLTIDGAADINGDGVMEVFGTGGLYENANFYAWDAGSADRDPKVLFQVING